MKTSSDQDTIQKAAVSAKKTQKICVMDQTDVSSGNTDHQTSLISAPSKYRFPSSAVSNPPMILRVVVFPQPEGPRNVINSPSLIYRFIESITFSPSYDFEIPFNSMSLSIVKSHVLSRTVARLNLSQAHENINILSTAIIIAKTFLICNSFYIISFLFFSQLAVISSV